MERYDVPDGRITVFSLTYCPYCVKTREYLTGRNYDFDYIEVDALEGEERKRVVEFVKKNNPRSSFPTVIFGDTGEIVVGYEPDELDDALKIMENEYPGIKKKSASEARQTEAAPDPPLKKTVETDSDKGW